MESAVYEIEAQVESAHWWFVGRRKLFARELLRLDLPLDAPVLDIGSGTGSNLRMLKGLGFNNVCGLDASPEAIAFCEAKSLGPVRQGRAESLPFPDGHFRLVLATDVIEHIEDDLHALREIRRVLVPGGHLLLTVPAFQSLWGLQDVVGRHRRRYRLSPLLRLLRDAGIVPLHAYYFNYLLFVPIWAARQVIRHLNKRIASENELNTGMLNRLFTQVFALDVLTAPLVRPPFGVSALVMAARPA
jgi:SAM-dependent methyltransferase